MARPDIRGQWECQRRGVDGIVARWVDLYRDLVNTPAFFELLPPVDGLVYLDLGCGEGHNTRLLAGKGARIAALDIAESFIAAATEAGPAGFATWWATGPRCRSARRPSTP